jgi:cytochrome c oxidase assembly protein subunit 15
MTTATLTAVPQASSAANRRAVALWLLGVALLVFLMAMVGAATRLTESGLSMVRWEPLTVIPPITEAQWQAELDAYRASPQYQQVNRGMSLAEFQEIYWWEFAHRQLGRFIGLAYALPLLAFALARRIPEGYGPRLFGLLALGGLQGAIGWWMVASGLVDEPAVSHYRLATHLSVALILFGGLLWTALDLLDTRTTTDSRKLRSLSAVMLGLLGLQIVFGAFVAGLDAGFAFNTWPLMGDRFMPLGTFGATWWHDLHSNPVTVQFIHRLLAYLLFGHGLILAWRAWTLGDETLRSWAVALVGILTLQMVLGIATVMLGVPVALGTAHQGGAVALLGVTLVLMHRVWHPAAR